MRRAYQVSSIILILIGLLALQQTLLLQYMTKTAGVGPGFLPLWTTIGLLIVAVALFVNSTRTEPVALPPNLLPDRASVQRLVLTVLGLAAVVAFINVVGFGITMCAFFLWVLIVIGRYSWWRSVLFAVFTSWFLFYLFNERLMIPLPIGPFGF